MSEAVSLKDTERKAFTATHNDGLWDILLGCFILVFAIAPFLSASMGDLWSSVVFLPFWGLVYLAIRLIRKHVVTPRVGIVKWGHARKAKLRRFSLIMLAVNVFALILGFIAATNVGKIPGQMITLVFALGFLLAFSIAAYFLDFSRLYVYGLLVGFSPLVGEWLWLHNKASHHGFPVTFGTSAAVMIVVGLIVFVRLVRDNPLPVEGVPSEEA
jgi:hypothetical protein